MPFTRTNNALHARAWLEVNLDFLLENARVLVERSGVPLIAMVKAAGYGHGLVPVSRALVDWANAHDGARPLYALGTATLDEALVLTAEFEPGEARIFCCGPLLREQLEVARAAGIIPALCRAEDIIFWNEHGGGEWHLSIDTGMQRAGVSWNDVDTLHAIGQLAPPVAAFTHFHSAERRDGSREVQEQRLASAMSALPYSANVPVHTDNSAAIAHRGASSGVFVRPGLSLFGGSTFPELAVTPVASMRTRILEIRDVCAGETVSYGAGWTAGENCRIATIGIGHGDGYRQSLSNRGEVLVHGQRAKVCGVVTMDMTMIDVTRVGCSVGDVVTLIGRDGDDAIHPSDVAAAAGVSIYELFMGYHLRVPRFYVGEGHMESHA